MRTPDDQMTRMIAVLARASKLNTLSSMNGP